MATTEFTLDEAIADCRLRRIMARKLGDELAELRLDELIDHFLDCKLENREDP